LLLIPAVIWAAARYGGSGAGYVWVSLNLLSFLILIPLVHRRFFPGLNRQWFMKDVLAIVSAGVLSGALTSRLMLQDAGRWIQLAEVAGAAVLILLASAAASSELRAKMKGLAMLRRQRATA
jgi:hypothetical protein